MYRDNHCRANEPSLRTRAMMLRATPLVSSLTFSFTLYMLPSHPLHLSNLNSPSRLAADYPNNNWRTFRDGAFRGRGGGRSLMPKLAACDTRTLFGGIDTPIGSMCW